MIDNHCKNLNEFVIRFHIQIYKKIKFRGNKLERNVAYSLHINNLVKWQMDHWRQGRLPSRWIFSNTVLFENKDDKWAFSSYLPIILHEINKLWWEKSICSKIRTLELQIFLIKRCGASSGQFCPFWRFRRRHSRNYTGTLSQIKQNI